MPPLIKLAIYTNYAWCGDVTYFDTMRVGIHSKLSCIPLNEFEAKSSSHTKTKLNSVKCCIPPTIG
jgi:hypothetical protein